MNFRETAQQLIRDWLFEDCKEKREHAESMKGAFNLTSRIELALFQAHREGTLVGMKFKAPATGAEGES